MDAMQVSRLKPCVISSCHSPQTSALGTDMPTVLCTPGTELCLVFAASDKAAPESD